MFKRRALPGFGGSSLGGSSSLTRILRSRRFSSQTPLGHLCRFCCHTAPRFSGSLRLGLCLLAFMRGFFRDGIGGTLVFQTLCGFTLGTQPFVRRTTQSRFFGLARLCGCNCRSSGLCRTFRSSP